MKNIDISIHDVRNPLNTISVSAELGKLALEQSGNADDAIRAFEKIIAQCQLCSEAINELRESIKNTE